MERLAFKTVELWVVLLLAVLAIVGATLFGAVVLDAERTGGRLGWVSQAAVAVAELPDTARRLTKPDDTMIASLGRSARGSGWTSDPTAAGGLDGYLLLSRYDGDASRHVVELRSLPDGEVRLRWQPEVSTLLDGVDLSSHILEPTHLRDQYFRVIHPLLFPDGDLLIKDQQLPLFRIDACSDKVWGQTDLLFHHSTEPDGEGGYWVPSYIDPSEIEDVGPTFFDDALAHVDAEGQVTFLRSLAQILIDNGHFPMLFTAGSYQDDPLHLNDIQPVLSDGPFWREGDLFLSLRHLSTVVLYRPSINRIIWMKQGPWLAQHDVDILDDHRIAVFDNNAYDKGRGGYVDGVSDIMVYDFATDEVSTPYHEAMARNHVVTLFEGLFSILPSGHLFVEQANAGRVLVMTPEGDVASEFVNRAQDGRVYDLGWSRVVEQDLGEAAITAAAGIRCDP